MAADSSHDPLQPPSEAPSRQVAADVGATVAEQVRRAIESAERSAHELRLRALNRASADREAVERLSTSVLDQIDTIEAQIGELLRLLRDEVERISEEEKRQELPTAVTPPDQEPVARPTPASPEPGPPNPMPPPPTHRRRRGLFRRREATATSCAVCGRTAQPGDAGLDRWVHGAGLSLCPDCRDERWQLPPGATVPYRPSHRT